LQATLKCGTNCGSCLPELRRLVAAAPEPQVVDEATAVAGSVP
jgi:assimilatory nitrate reductase catalytic subunit